MLISVKLGCVMMVVVSVCVVFMVWMGDCCILMWLSRVDLYEEFSLRVMWIGVV